MTSQEWLEKELAQLALDRNRAELMKLLHPRLAARADRIALALDAEWFAADVVAEQRRRAHADGTLLRAFWTAVQDKTLELLVAEGGKGSSIAAWRHAQ